MKKKAKIFSTLLLFGFMVLFALPSFGQNAIPIDQVSSVVPTTPNRKKSMLSIDELNAKDLYEQAYGVTLSESQFREKCGSKQVTLMEWQTVLTTFANDPSKDLTVVQNIVTTMNQKLN